MSWRIGALLALASLACEQARPPALGVIEAAASAKTAWLFDDDAAPRHLRLEVAPQDWEWLNANPLLEQWVPATVHFEGQTFTNAAVRYKGAVGSLYSCVDATGALTCRKLSLKVSFNEVDKSGRFYGVRKLVLNACNRDDTYLRERLAYAAFRDAGVVAPRAVHMRVSVNDGPESLYLAVENPDKELLEERFADPDGDLYKEAWPRSLDPAWYASKLKTNENTSTGARLLALAKALDSTPKPDHPALVDAWMDRPLMARYLAVDQAVNNWDGVTRFYCGGASCSNHNFYLYDDPTTGRLVVIPWDLDFTFVWPDDQLGRSWSDEGPGACDPEPVNGVATVLPAQCDPLVGVLVGDQAAWLDALATLSAPGGALDLDRLLGRLDGYRAQIREVAETDPLGPGAAEWRRATARLRETLRAQAAHIAARLAEGR